MTSPIIASIRAEYRRYQLLAERAMDQVPDALLAESGESGGNSIITIAWHIAGNLHSRFTDFLTDDGEKPWRDRENEFAQRDVSRDELRAHWSQGWTSLFTAIDPLTDADLARTIIIRGQPLTVGDALHRSLAHASYHVGQLVYVAHAKCGPNWSYLSIPPGGSAAYNAAPTHETADAHAARLRAGGAGDTTSTAGT